MGPFTAYSLHVALLLLAGYLIYKVLLASEKQPRLNRALLLGIYAAAFAAFPIGALLARLSGAAHPVGGAVPDLPIPIGETLAPQTAVRWPLILIAVYFTGMCLAAACTTVTMLRLALLIRSGRRTDGPEGTVLLLLDNRKIAPFSLGNYIVMNADDYATGGALITAHELAHIRHRHSVDLLVAQLVCILQWFNPAAWLMREELKAVHEFQADESVLASGIEARQYQLLLIKKAVGTRFRSLANSLSHSNLKKRITMMYSKKSSGRRRMRSLALVPAIAAALAVSNFPVVASVLSATSQATFGTTEVAIDSKVSENPAPDQKSEPVPDRMPEMPETIWQYLIKETKYPEEAAKNNIEGKVLVGFTVNTDGSISDVEVRNGVDKDLDAEAVRVVKGMPHWKPAISDGKPVKAQYALPINFSLKNMKKTAK
ncbi:MAG: M56 family metallopeptidase [Bacteroidales bacterium]|nr:M56 family metallopeptidase [Bacteroidales bacterium]